MSKKPVSNKSVSKPSARNRLARRSALKLLGGAALGSATIPLWKASHARAQTRTDDPRFLIVIGAQGGASIIDSALAIRASESANAATVNTFADSLVTTIPGSALRAVTMSRGDVGAIPQSFTADQVPFMTRHRDDLLVATWERSSVNHAVGQRRAVTGNEIWNGRMLQEIVATQYGEGFPIPNVQLQAGTGTVGRGTDSSIPDFAFGEPVTDPTTWPLALDGLMGTRARNIPRSLLTTARETRAALDDDSVFGRVLGRAKRIEHWKRIRGAPLAAIENEDLISKLTVVPDTPATPLSDYGLSTSTAGAAVREKFPEYATDPLEAQAALAFLLLKNRATTTVTIGPSNAFISGNGGGDINMKNTPIAFDFSHQGHRSTQAFMWNRVMKVVDGLATLLKAEEWAEGQSMWDRTMVYISPDFGRSKVRPPNANEWGTGHHLNNGVMVISPLVNGNTVLGGVDPNTGLTYGFDPVTGAPDVGHTMSEAEIFSGLLSALDIDTTGSGLPAMPIFRRP